MANIGIYTNAEVNIDLGTEEIETIKNAYTILREISNELWREDGGDETETFGNTSTACDCIYEFMKNDIGVDLREKKQ